MKEKNYNILILLISLIFVAVTPCITIMYMVKEFTVLNLVALIINIIAIPIVSICLIKEVKKSPTDCRKGKN